MRMSDADVGCRMLRRMDDVRRPILLSMSEAAAVIRAAAMGLHPKHPTAAVVVGVTGAVAAGKSTLAQAVGEIVVSTDHYLPDYEVTPEHLRDLPESSDLARLARDIAELRAGRATRIPQWSFESHSRVGELHVEPAPIVVVEGLHALHETVRGHVDVAVFVEAPREVRWSRAMARELAGDRPWPIEYLEHFFANVAEPTFARHAGGYRAGADFLVVNG
jgi:uridine kinase